MQSAALQVVIWIVFATHSPATKWSLGYTGRSESNSHWAGTAREVTRWMKAFSQPLPQSPQNSHQPGKKLSFYPKWGEIKKSDITDSRRMLLTDKLLLFFFYLSVKVYCCYSNLSSIFIHAECRTRVLGYDPESNFGIQVIWFICICCIYLHYNCTWKKANKIEYLVMLHCTGKYLTIMSQIRECCQMSCTIL